MPKQHTLTQDRLKELLQYNPDDGWFYRKTCRQKYKAGEKAGSIMECGYVRIGVDRRQYLAHRLAWFYIHGAWPEGELDHVNGVKPDNRIRNLRDVTHAQNLQNQVSARRDNSLGVLGVHRYGNKFIAGIRYEGKKLYLGVFESLVEASDAYAKAKQIYHPHVNFADAA